MASDFADIALLLGLLDYLGDAEAASVCHCRDPVPMLQ